MVLRKVKKSGGRNSRRAFFVPIFRNPPKIFSQSPEDFHKVEKQ